MRTISDENSARIVNLGFLCAIFVVIIHVVWPHAETLSVTWLMHHFVRKGIALIAVPFFFVVSGYFLVMRSSNPGWWCAEMKKRVRTLLIPYLFWSVCAAIWGVAITMSANVLGGRDVFYRCAFGWRTLVDVLGLDFHVVPAQTPFWYLRCLMVFVCLLPLIRKCTERGGCFWLGIAFVGNLALSILGDPTEKSWITGFFLYGCSLSGLFYFSLGIFFARCRRFEVSNLTAVASWIVGLVLLALAVFIPCTRVSALFRTVSALFLLIGLWAVIPTKKWRFAQGLAFPIFLMHMMMFECGYVLCHHFNLADCYRCWILLVMGGGGPILISKASRCFAPRFATWAFGGR